MATKRSKHTDSSAAAAIPIVPSSSTANSHSGCSANANRGLTNELSPCDLGLKCHVARRTVIDRDHFTNEIECANCAKSIHFGCIGVKFWSDVWDIDVFNCAKCQATTGPSTYFDQPKNRHRQNPFETGNHLKTQSGTPAFIDWIKQRERNFTSGAGVIWDVRGSQLSEQLLKKYGHIEPILVRDTAGLQCHFPDTNWSLADMMDAIGLNRRVPVYDTRRQDTITMPAKELLRYMENEDADIKALRASKSRVFDSVSLNYLNTDLYALVKRPAIVDSLAWPADTKSYVFCSFASTGSFIDFTVGFGGSNCWYHVVRGSKVFYLISSAKLKQYGNWMRSGLDGLDVDRHLFSLVSPSEIVRVHVRAGETFFVPSGWIFAIRTPHDSVSLSGNYLSDLTVYMQAHVRQLELDISLKRCNQYDNWESQTGRALVSIARQINDRWPQKRSPPPLYLVNSCARLGGALNKMLQQNRLPTSLRFASPMGNDETPKDDWSTAIAKCRLIVERTRDYWHFELEDRNLPFLLLPESERRRIGPVTVKEEANVHDGTVAVKQEPAPPLPSAHLPQVRVKEEPAD